MKFSRSGIAALATALVMVVASCTDRAPTAPLAPAPAPNADLLGTLSNIINPLLLTCKPMPAYHASAVIGRSGGTLVIGPHKFVVPAGALSSNTLITADAPSDKLNRIQFQPEGLHFDKSASLTMSYANCQGLGSLLPKHIAYTNNLFFILEILKSVDDLGSNKVTGDVNHFSDYVIAW